MCKSSAVPVQRQRASKLVRDPGFKDGLFLSVCCCAAGRMAFDDVIAEEQVRDRRRAIILPDRHSWALQCLQSSWSRAKSASSHRLDRDDGFACPLASR